MQRREVTVQACLSYSLLPGDMVASWPVVKAGLTTTQVLEKEEAGCGLGCQGWPRTEG